MNKFVSSTSMFRGRSALKSKDPSLRSKKCANRSRSRSKSSSAVQIRTKKKSKCQEEEKFEEEGEENMIIKSTKNGLDTQKQ